MHANGVQVKDKSTPSGQEAVKKKHKGHLGTPLPDRAFSLFWYLKIRGSAFLKLQNIRRVADFETLEKKSVALRAPVCGEFKLGLFQVQLLQGWARVLNFRTGGGQKRNTFADYIFALTRG